MSRLHLLAELLIGALVLQTHPLEAAQLCPYDTGELINVIVALLRFTSVD